MKRVQVYSLLIVMISILFSCKKENTEEPYKCTTCKTTPDAVAAHDASSKGIYKGVIVASTGTIVFDVQNGGTTITAKLTIDGTVVNLTASQSWVSGQPYVSAFTGTLNGQPVSINFSVGISGNTPTVTSSNIPGHSNATFVIVKETSTNLIEAYEGTFTGTQKSGTLNLILSKSSNSWYGAAKSNGSTTSNNFSGSLNGSSINGLGPSNTVVTGTLGNDIINGNFSDPSQTGTWTAKRTL